MALLHSDKIQEAIAFLLKGLTIVLILWLFLWLFGVDVKSLIENGAPNLFDFL